VRIWKRLRAFRPHGILRSIEPNGLHVLAYATRGPIVQTFTCQSIDVDDVPPAKGFRGHLPDRPLNVNDWSVTKEDLQGTCAAIVRRFRIDGSRRRDTIGDVALLLFQLSFPLVRSSSAAVAPLDPAVIQWRRHLQCGPCDLIPTKAGRRVLFFSSSRWSFQFSKIGRKPYADNRSHAIVVLVIAAVT
jgi:hypothetical protein